MSLNKLFLLLPGEDDARGKGVEGTMKPAFLSNLDFMPHPSQAGYSNVVVS